MRTKLIFLVVFFQCFSLFAARFYVDDVSSNGNGTWGNPFNSIQSALSVAQPGDTILVLSGTYTPGATVETERDGTASQRITIKAYDPLQPPLITRSGRVFKFSDSYVTLDGFILDGQFGNSDVVNIKSGGSYTIIRNCEVKNGKRDGIDLSSANNVLIENCRIHHMLAGRQLIQFHELAQMPGLIVVVPQIIQLLPQIINRYGQALTGRTAYTVVH